jgi:PAS domain S-box-containing protein
MSSDANLQARIAELEAAHRRTQTVAEISARMSAAANEQEILSALDKVTQHYKADLSALSYFHTDDEGKVHTLEIVALQSGGGQPVPLDTQPSTHLSTEQHPFVQLIADTPDQVLFLEDIFTDPRCDEATRQQFKATNLSANITIPLKTGDRWHGIIGFNWTEPQTFDAELRQLLTELMPRITDVVAGRRAYLAEQEAHRFNRQLLEISRDLNAIRDIEEMIQALALPAIAAGAYSVILTNTELDATGEPEWNEIAATWQKEGPPHTPVGTRFYLPEFPATRFWFADPEAPFLASDINTDERLDEVTRTGLLAMGIGAQVVIPLTQAKRWVGLVLFSWAEPHEFSAQETAIYRALTSIASPAVENQRLVANLTQMVEARTAEIQEKQQLLQAFLENFPAMIFAKDHEDRFILSNERFAQVCGFTREELIGKAAGDLMPKEVTAPMWEREKQVMETGVVLEKEEPLQQAQQGDEVRTVRSTIFPLYDEQGQVRGAGGIMIDITEQKQAQIEHERLQQEVIDAQRAALRELSSPIIPVMEGIIVLPLIGSIDTGRAREITRTLLRGISEHRAKIIIMDITGVPVVDSGVADHLNKSIQAARLKGAQAIITGMSDAVAETIVDLGIDWAELQTLRDLQTGLTEAIRRLDIDIT